MRDGGRVAQEASFVLRTRHEKLSVFTFWDLQKGQVKSDFRIAVAVVCSWLHLYSKGFCPRQGKKEIILHCSSTDTSVSCDQNLIKQPEWVLCMLRDLPNT